MESENVEWDFPEEGVAALIGDFERILAKAGFDPDRAGIRLDLGFPSVFGGNGCVAVRLSPGEPAMDAVGGRLDEAVAERLGEGAMMDRWDETIWYVPVGRRLDAEEGTAPNPKVLGRDSMPEDYPSDSIRTAHALWRDLADEYGDAGPVALGQAIAFRFRGKSYRMRPLDRWQGCEGRESCAGAIMAALRMAGCAEVRFDHGRLD